MPQFASCSNNDCKLYLPRHYLTLVRVNMSGQMKTALLCEKCKKRFDELMRKQEGMK